MDRLTLKGYKEVTGQVGNELAWIQPLKGDFHKFPRWWNKKGTIQYESVTIFNVTRAPGDIKIVIPTSINTHIEMIWDDQTETFKFPIHRGVERVAIVDAATNALVQEYQFSRIAGGSVLKRTIAPLPSKTIGNVSITGSPTPDVGIAATYSVAHTGTAADLVYLWTCTDSSATITSPTAASTDITISEAGTFDVTCNISSATSSDSPTSVVISVTAT